MEETIGYEALFSAEEWHAIQTGDASAIYEEEDRIFGPLVEKWSVDR